LCCRIIVDETVKFAKKFPKSTVNKVCLTNFDNETVEIFTKEFGKLFGKDAKDADGNSSAESTSKSFKVPTYKFDIVQQKSEQTILVNYIHCKDYQFGRKVEESITKVFTFVMSELDSDSSKPPVTKIMKLDEEGYTVEFYIATGLVINARAKKRAEKIKNRKGLLIKDLPAGPCAHTIYNGDLEKFKFVYEAFKQGPYQDLLSDVGCWVVHQNFQEETNKEKWITHVYWPLDEKKLAQSEFSLDNDVDDIDD